MKLRRLRKRAQLIRRISAYGIQPEIPFDLLLPLVENGAHILWPVGDGYISLRPNVARTLREIRSL